MENNARMEHAELVSKDPAATQKFLEKAFGLKFTVLGPEMGNYRMHGREQGVPNNAIGIREPMGPEHPGTISYLTVPNIDEAITAVKVAGGKIVLEKTEVPQVGYTAITTAPGEITLGLFQYNAPRPKE
jgi:predicted enzyme related to lactoylglutathione lyase